MTSNYEAKIARVLLVFWFWQKNRHRKINKILEKYSSLLDVLIPLPLPHWLWYIRNGFMLNKM